MRNKIHYSIFAFIFLLLIIPSALAFSPTITVYTEHPDHGLIVRIKDANTNQIFDSIYPKINASGVAVGNYSTSREQLAFTVMIIKNGQVVLSKDFDAQPTNKNIELRMVESAANTTEQNSTNATIEQTEETEQTAGITGAAISKIKSLPSFTWYVLVGFLVAAIAIFFIARHFIATKFPVPPPTPPGAKPAQPSIQTKPPSVEESIEEEIKDAEEKIKQAQTEIEKVKSKEKVYEAEKKFQQAKDELEKLKQDNNPKN